MKNIFGILLVLLSISAFTQVLDTHSTDIDNISISYDGSQVVVFYDLSYPDDKNAYYVELEFMSKNKNELIKARSLTGDIGIVNSGFQKKILWDFKTDGVYFNEEIFVKIKATPQPDIKLWEHLGKSLILPGWGDFKLRNKHWALGYGVIGYSSIAASIAFNQKAVSDYNKYLETTDPLMVDKYFNSAKLSNNISYIFAGVAVTSWIVDIAGVLIRQKRIKNRLVSVENNYYYKISSKNEFIAMSDPKYINTTDVVLPPYLKIDNTSLKFTDQDGNNCLNAGEKAVIEFTLKNIGKGVANNLVVKTLIEKDIPGLSYNKEKPIGSLASGEEVLVSLPLEGSMDIISSTVKLNIEIIEALDFNPEPVFISFVIQEYVPPSIIIADHNFTIEGGGKAEKGKITNLELIVQNIGQGIGEKISVSFVLPENVTEIGDRIFYIEKLAPNEKKLITFEFVSKKSFEGNQLSIMVNLKEKHNKYSKKDNEFVLEFEEVLDKTNIVVEPNITDTDITEGSFKSDIDKNIPVSKKKNPNLYVLIIGNEDYQSYQTGLDAEMNVEFALNDARTFYNYAIKTLGAEKEHIDLIVNGTSGQINQMITRYNTIAQFMGEDAEIMVYYAGHGLPDEKTKEPYLIPVDISGTDLTNAISLEYLFQKLTEHETKRVTVILDACFSGGARNESLIAARGVKVEPENGVLLGNLIVFSSSSGNESSSSYDDKFHGLFTYYFLKKLQETKGDVSYKDMSDYLERTVKMESLIINNKIQTPNIQFSNDISKEWENWRLVE